MYGYITVNRPELKIREFEIYQSYYCGLCKEIKSSFGQMQRFTLTYDMTFLYMLHSSLYEPETKVKPCRCELHPVSSLTGDTKGAYGIRRMEARNECAVYAADMSVFMAYLKCIDDYEDEKFSVKGITGIHMLHKAALKVRKKYPEKTRLILKYMKELKQAQDNDNQDIDIISGLFGKVLGNVFSYRDDAWQNILYKTGFYLGKFIYIYDAYDDIEKDIKNNCYNPLKNIYNEMTKENKNQLSEKNETPFAMYCKKMMMMMIAPACAEFEKLPLIENVEILRNILYSGVWSDFYNK